MFSAEELENSIRFTVVISQILVLFCYFIIKWINKIDTKDLTRQLFATLTVVLFLIFSDFLIVNLKYLIING